MPAHSQHPVALEYARAMLQLANEQNMAEAVGSELAGLKQIIAQTPSAAELLADPAIGLTERARLVDAIFKDGSSPLVYNLLGVMNGKSRLGLIAQVADAFEELLARQMGRIDVGVISAQPLDAAALEDVRQRVSEALGKIARLKPSVDESIIGGLVLRIEDQLIDGSVRGQLESMRQQLTAAAPR